MTSDSDVIIEIKYFFKRRSESDRIGWYTEVAQEDVLSSASLLVMNRYGIVSN